MTAPLKLNHRHTARQLTDASKHIFGPDICPASCNMCMHILEERISTSPQRPSVCRAKPASVRRRCTSAMVLPEALSLTSHLQQGKTWQLSFPAGLKTNQTTRNPCQEHHFRCAEQQVWRHRHESHRAYVRSQRMHAQTAAATPFTEGQVSELVTASGRHQAHPAPQRHLNFRAALRQAQLELLRLRQCRISQHHSQLAVVKT